MHGQVRTTRPSIFGLPLACSTIRTSARRPGTAPLASDEPNMPAMSIVSVTFAYSRASPYQPAL